LTFSPCRFPVFFVENKHTLLYHSPLLKSPSVEKVIYYSSLCFSRCALYSLLWISQMSIIRQGHHYIYGLCSWGNIT
jgi:hypothetical protein